MKKPYFSLPLPNGAELNLYKVKSKQARVEIYTGEAELDGLRLLRGWGNLARKDLVLNPVEMLDFGNQMIKLANELLLAEAIETAFNMRDEDERFAVLRELGSVQEVAAKYESFNTLHIEKLSDFDRAVVLAVGMAYRDVMQSYLHVEE